MFLSKASRLAKIIHHDVQCPTFRSYFWEAASEAGLHCRDACNLYLAKSLRKPFQIQTAKCGQCSQKALLVHLQQAPFLYELDRQAYCRTQEPFLSSPFYFTPNVS